MQTAYLACFTNKPQILPYDPYSACFYQCWVALKQKQNVAYRWLAFLYRFENGPIMETITSPSVLMLVKIRNMEMPQKILLKSSMWRYSLEGSTLGCKCHTPTLRESSKLNEINPDYDMGMQEKGKVVQVGKNQPTYPVALKLHL